MQFKQMTPFWNHILMYFNVITNKIHICSHFLTYIVSNFATAKNAIFNLSLFQSFFKKVKKKNGGKFTINFLFFIFPFLWSFLSHNHNLNHDELFRKNEQCLKKYKKRSNKQRFSEKPARFQHRKVFFFLKAKAFRKAWEQVLQL